MGLLYESVLRPFLFRRDAEDMHELAVRQMTRLGKHPWLCRMLAQWNLPNPAQVPPVKLFGLDFPTTVGLAAGFDKNATCWPAAAALGFGHVEIGTVTARAQPGNPRPRAFRFPEEEALINRMGFNNDGAEMIAARLKDQSGRPRRIPLGINIGKSKVTSLEDAAADYLASFRWLADYADYVTINISSPNTPDLRKLQGDEHLRTLLQAMAQANRDREKEDRKRLPMLLKIAPDLTFPMIDHILQTIADHGFDGIIATNTTIARPVPFSEESEKGGLSGRPLTHRSTEIIRYISRQTNGRLPIIGTGGIMDPVSAAEKMDAGAHLLQIYTGLVYRGPLLARDLGLALRLRQQNWPFLEKPAAVL